MKKTKRCEVCKREMKRANASYPATDSQGKHISRGICNDCVRAGFNFDSAGNLIFIVADGKDGEEGIDKMLPAFTLWKSRLELFEKLSLKLSSAEADEDYCGDVMDALFESVAGSTARGGQSPWNTFTLRLKKHGDKLQLKISAEITPNDEES